MVAIETPAQPAKVKADSNKSADKARRLVTTWGMSFLLISSYVAVPLYVGAMAMYPSILLVKPPFADMSVSARFRPLNGI